MLLRQIGGVNKFLLKNIFVFSYNSKCFEVLTDIFNLLCPEKKSTKQWIVLAHFDGNCYMNAFVRRV